MTTQSTTLWLKFHNVDDGILDLQYNESERVRFATFEEFKSNFLVGWGDADEPNPEWLVQDECPSDDAKWNAPVVLQ